MSDLDHLDGTVPYPWPYDGRLDGRRLALVICGAQRTLVAASAAAAAIEQRLIDAAAAVRAADGTVIWVRHGARQPPRRPTAWLPTRGTAGWQLTSSPEDGDEVVDAGGWDGCFGSDLAQLLGARGCDLAVLSGFASEITVDSTIRTLNDRGIECLVLTDACAPLDSDLGRRAHASVTMSGGIFGALGTTVALLDALARGRPIPAGIAGPTKETLR